MIRIKDTKFQNTAAALGNAIRIAEYYGFMPLENIPRSEGAARRAMQPLSKIESEITLARRDERTLPSVARKLLSRMGNSNDALLAWRIAPIQGGIPALALELHIAGPSSAIAEALLIVIGNAIAEEAGLNERALSLNNIGSQESSSRYVRDVGLYLRKHLESIAPALRPRAASDPLGTLVHLIERGHPAAPRAPQAMEYLTEDERRRFWELLEYLEMHGLAYELNAHILGSRDFWSQSLFELSMTDAESGVRIPYAFGGRYDPLASRFFKAPASAAMLSLSFEIKGATRVRREMRAPSGEMQPAIYFAHLGLEARRRVLGVLEQLRRASIPVHHSIWHDRIGEQMMRARTLAVPYILIMGHKEAMEGTVLVREVATNSQDAIPLLELPGYLKRRRVGVSREAHA